MRLLPFESVITYFCVKLKPYCVKSKHYTRLENHTTQLKTFKNFFFNINFTTKNGILEKD